MTVSVKCTLMCYYLTQFHNFNSVYAITCAFIFNKIIVCSIFRQIYLFVYQISSKQSVRQRRVHRSKGTKCGKPNKAHKVLNPLQELREKTVISSTGRGPNWRQNRLFSRRNHTTMNPETPEGKGKSAEFTTISYIFIAECYSKCIYLSGCTVFVRIMILNKQYVYRKKGQCLRHLWHIVQE